MGTSDQLFYCVEEAHPGAPAMTSDPLSSARFFTVKNYDDSTCPECPACGREVTAIPCQQSRDGEPVPPPSILDLAARFSV